MVGVLVDVMIGAAGVSGLIGLTSVLGKHAFRSTGPIGDPNDFAFVLAATIPLIIHRLRWPGTRHPALVRAATTACLVVAFTALLGTLSRGGLLGLASALAWALATRRIRLRWAVGAAVAGLAVVGMAFVLQSHTVHNALHAKNAVANNNVVTRLYYWDAAYREFRLAPITGVGPGNFENRVTNVAPFQAGGATADAATTVDTTHNTYLNILAELGAPGLTLFVAYLILSWLVLRRRIPDDRVPDDRKADDRRFDDLQAALAAGFVASVVAAVFLTEQYYAPLWLLPALGACSALAKAPAAAGAGGWPDRWTSAGGASLAVGR